MNANHREAIEALNAVCKQHKVFVFTDENADLIIGFEIEGDDEHVCGYSVNCVPAQQVYQNGTVYNLNELVTDCCNAAASFPSGKTFGLCSRCGDWCEAVPTEEPTEDK
jgi:hypothetical protein